MHTNQSVSLWQTLWASKKAAGASKTVWQTVRIWLARSRTRRMLTELDNHMLRDIGINRMDALREADRMPWDGDDAAHWQIIRRLP